MSVGGQCVEHDRAARGIRSARPPARATCSRPSRVSSSMVSGRAPPVGQLGVEGEQIDLARQAPGERLGGPGSNVGHDVHAICLPTAAHDRLQRVHQLGELVRVERLRAVRPGFGGVFVHLDQQAVGAARRRGQRHRDDEVADARAVRRIDQHRQVRLLLHIGDGVEVERVARRRLEGADAALAQDDLSFAGRRADIRRRAADPRPWPQARASAAPACRRSPTAFSREKFCMLRAPIWSASACSATMSTSAVSITSVTTGRPSSSPILRRSVQALRPVALEGIGAGARLVGAGAQADCARRLHRLAAVPQPLLGLDRAGSGDHREAAPADARRAELHDRVVRDASRG